MVEPASRLPARPLPEVTRLIHNVMTNMAILNKNLTNQLTTGWFSKRYKPLNWPFYRDQIPVRVV